jgi:hypothetical protein
MKGDGKTENGPGGRGYTSVIVLVWCARIIIIVAFCRRTKHNSHFEKEFHLCKRCLPSSVVVLHPSCTNTKQLLDSTDATTRPQLRTETHFTLLPCIYGDAIGRVVISTITCHFILWYSIKLSSFLLEVGCLRTNQGNNLRFSWRWLWKVLSYRMWDHVVFKVFTDVSEEYIASISGQ